MGFSRKRGPRDESKEGTPGDQTPMEQSVQDASMLQDVVEKWQVLAANQQDIALRLEELAGAQHALANRWDAAGDQDLSAEARQLEKTLRDLIRLALHLEAQALERIERVVAAEESSLRTR